MPPEFRVVPAKADRGRVCEALLRALPDWFGIEAAIAEYARDVTELPGFVAYDGEAAVGLIALRPHGAWSHEIHVMAVHPAYHRMGVGSALVTRAEASARAAGAPFLTVKTLGPSREDAHYARTRRFYEAQGFMPLEEFATFWSPGNPMLLMVKRLHTED